MCSNIRTSSSYFICTPHTLHHRFTSVCSISEHSHQSCPLQNKIWAKTSQNLVSTSQHREIRAVKSCILYETVNLCSLLFRFLLSQHFSLCATDSVNPPKNKKKIEGEWEEERGESPYFTVQCCKLHPGLHTHTHTSHLSSLEGVMTHTQPCFM